MDAEVQELINGMTSELRILKGTVEKLEEENYQHKIAISSMQGEIAALKGTGGSLVKEPEEEVPETPIVVPVVQYATPYEYWKHFFMPEMIGIKFEIPGGEWGYFILEYEATTDGQQFPVLKWHCDKVKSSPEWFGQQAFLPAIWKRYEEMFNALFVPLFGKSWHDARIYQFKGSEYGLTSHMTGIPMTLSCGERPINGLK